MYALAGAVCWALLGTVLGALPLQLAGLIVVVAYGAYFGTVEALGRRGVPPPGNRWQVPQRFARNASRRRKLVIWGGILGPGFLDPQPLRRVRDAGGAGRGRREPVAWPHRGGTIGACHGTGRALALLRDARQASGLEYLSSVAKSLYWRHCDGLALAAIAAAMLAGYRGML